MQPKKIILGISGSIAAYKAILLVRKWMQAGVHIKVVMTPAAKDFVSPLTLATLTQEKVLIDLFDENASWANHVMLGRWADAMVIAPASCNSIAKMAQGCCDNLLLAIYLSAICPVVVAPAMDEDMWKHPATKANLEKLRGYGNHIVPVNNGLLASGLIGEGRMAEPEEIISFVDTQLFTNTTTSLGKKIVLISAGPTQEAIDPVRFISNHSSGKMGIAIAEEAAARGATVHLVLGPTPQTPQHPNIHVHKVVTAEQMYTQCTHLFEQANVAIMTAAVADYTPLQAATEKIKKQDDGLHIELSKTKDILQTLGMRKKDNQILVGFALETNNERAYARDKLHKKKADLIVLNSLTNAGSGFGHDTNQITIFAKNGQEWDFPQKSKKEVAKDIWNKIEACFLSI